MATKYHGAGTLIHVDELDVSGMLNTVDINADRDTVEVTTHDKSEKEYITGKPGNTISAGGFFSAADDGLDVQQFTDINTPNSNIVSVVRAPGDVGDEGWAITGSRTSDVRAASVAGAITWNGEWQGTEGIIAGVCLADAATISSTGAQTGYELFKAVGSTDGAGLVLHATANTGSFGSFAAKVEYSTDSTDGSDGTWADWGTLATGSITALGAVFQTETAGAALSDGDWLRLNVTDLTTLTDITITAVAGLYVDG